jgi:hypothetical protein
MRRILKKIFKILRKCSAEENIPQSIAENANKMKISEFCGEFHQHSENSNFLQNQITTLILLILNTTK